MKRFLMAAIAVLVLGSCHDELLDTYKEPDETIVADPITYVDTATDTASDPWNQPEHHPITFDVNINDWEEVA